MRWKDGSGGDEGWTLLELMAVVLVLGILVSIAIATYNMSVTSARKVACEGNRHTLETAVETYREDHDGMPPPDLESVSPYVANDSYGSCPSDPHTHYVYEPANGRITCPLHP